MAAKYRAEINSAHQQGEARYAKVLMACLPLVICRRTGDLAGLLHECPRKVARLVYPQFYVLLSSSGGLATLSLPNLGGWA